MPSWGSNILRIPPGPPVANLETDRENFLIVQRVQVLRPTTAYAVASWVAGNPANPNPDQPGKYVIYSDVAGAPANLIAQSGEILITGLDPSGRCTTFPLVANVFLAPGFYWVGSFTGTQPGGAGEWIWRGISGNAFGLAPLVSAFSGAAVSPPPGFTNKILTTEGNLQTTGTGSVQLNSGTEGTAWLTTPTLGPDVEAFQTLDVKQGNGDSVRLYVRLLTPGTATCRGYILKVRAQSGVDTWEMFRIDNGVEVKLGADIGTQEIAANDGYGISVVGNVLTAWYRPGLAGAWVQVGTTRVDSTYPGAGYVGMGLNFSTCRLGDFYAYTLPAGGYGNAGQARRVASPYGSGVPPATFPAGSTALTYQWGIGINVIQEPQTTPLGAICGTFLCGQYLAGEIRWPFNEPFLDLVPGRFNAIDSVPLVASVGKPLLDLVPRAFIVGIGQSPPVNKAILDLVPRAFVAFDVETASLAKPFLDLLPRSFGLSLSSSVPFGKPFLDLVPRLGRPKIPALIPSVPVDVILVPSAPADGTLLLTPTVEEDGLLIPTTEALG